MLVEKLENFTLVLCCFFYCVGINENTVRSYKSSNAVLTDR